jgi:FKBP-type peptidyl-prolyl cis-trans isomerase FkpA
MKYYLYLIFTSVFLFSCSNNDATFDPQTEEDIITYIEDNNLDAQRSDSGLYYVITNEGTGARPSASSNVTVTYKGYFLNGSVFDQNANGYTTNLTSVIEGWTEGITYFKEGGEGVLLIPSNLGYGDSGRATIPGGAVLVFDIRLIRIN